MKVCLLTPRYPFPEKGGDVIRINSIAKYFKSKGYEVILVSFLEQDQDVVENSIYDKVFTYKRKKILSIINCILFFILGKSLQCGYYHSRKYNKLFRNVIASEQPDLYVSHLLRMVQYLEINNLNDKSIVEMTDALSKTYDLVDSSSVRTIKSFVYKIEKKRIAAYENEVIARFKKISLVSQTDIDYLGHPKNLFLYSLGMNVIENKEKFNKNKICFIGNMRTLQNQDAVVFFYNEIFPKLKIKYPKLEFHIVGAEPPSEILRLNDNCNVFVTGFVESVYEYIKDSYLAIAPVNIAAGVQYKVLTSMSVKIPVLLSSLIAESIPELEDKKNCMICSNNEEYINKIEMLLENEQIRNMIAENGYAMIDKNYSVFAKLEGYEKIIKEV